MKEFMEFEEFINQEPHCEFCGSTFPTREESRAHMCDGLADYEAETDRRRAEWGIGPKQWRR